MQKLFYENLNSTKLRKNLLGGLVGYGGEVEWLLRTISMVYTWVCALVDGHPGNKGIWRTPSDVSFQCSHCQYGLWLDQLRCVDSPRPDRWWSWFVDGARQASMGRENASERSRLILLLSLSQMVCKGIFGLNGYNGERAQPLQSVNLST